MEYLLVLILKTGPIFAPTKYPHERACQEAGLAWRAEESNARSRRFVCIPAGTKS